MYLQTYFSILFPILGLLIGSFLNVCIYRIPKKESIAVGASHCTSCRERIKPYDLIPLFSYIFLGGKCRSCKSKISLRYPAIELLNALLYTFAVLTFGLTLKCVMLCAMFSILIVISMIDLDTGEIPNGLSLALIIISSLGFISNDIPFWHRLIGFAAASGILLILAIFTNGFGGGDIKMMAGCGLILGWKNVLLALFVGVVLGGAIGAVKLIQRKRTVTDDSVTHDALTMPFGPALAIGCIVCAFYGEHILSWYISLIS